MATHRSREISGEARGTKTTTEKLTRITGILGNFMKASALYSKGVRRLQDDPRLIIRDFENCWADKGSPR